jgi:hypothetical protein
MHEQLLHLAPRIVFFHSKLFTPRRSLFAAVLIVHDGKLFYFLDRFLCFRLQHI